MKETDNTDHSHLVPLVGRLGAARILCVGDVMLDRFIYGEVDRISPEAPIPVLKISHETAMPGGAGNVVRNLAALGSRSVLIGVTGTDAAADQLAGLFDEEPLLEHRLLRVAGRQTSVKTRLMTCDQHLLRADRDEDGDLPEAVVDALLEQALAAVQEVDAVMLSDYGKGVLADRLIRELTRAARQAGKPVVVDPKGTDYSRYAGASLVTPNRKELSQASGMPVADDAQVAAAARVLIEKCGIDAVLATRSQDGMTLVVADGTVCHIRAMTPLEVFDVSGAGDTVAATLCAGLGAGLDLADAAGIANVAAGIVVGKVGTAVTYADELVAAMRAGDLMQDERKVVTLAQALEQVLLWRNQGRSVGLTNGCFDLLHPGHISLLRQARQACDRLLVAVNSDASVRRLKGEDRPVQTEAARATVIAHVSGVDAVVIFEEDTPLAIIEAVRPDVLVKGADYAEDEVVGGDLVKANGGRVVLADIIDGFSTTATVTNLKRKAGS